MLKHNVVFSLIVPNYKLRKEGTRNIVDKTCYKQLIESLMYLTTTRLDMMFITYLISKYLAKPMDIHVQVAKKALQYLKGIVDYGIDYRTIENGVLFLLSSSIVS